MRNQRPLLLGVDVGSSSIKSALISVSGQIVSSAKVPLPILVHEEFKEIRLEDLWTAFAQSILRLDDTGTELHNVTGIGITTQMAGFILLDDQQKGLRNGILGVDQRGSSYIASFIDRVDHNSIHALTGCPLSGIYPAVKWLWTLDCEPLIAAKTSYLGGIKEYLLWKLTGRWVTDPASASTTQLFNQAEKRWSSELLGGLDLKEEMLPIIQYPDELAGNLTSALAEELHLPSGIPVAVGTGDGPASNLSTGSISGKELCVSLGTTAVTRYVTEHPSQPKIGQAYFQQYFGWDLYFQGSRVDRAGGYIQSVLSSPEQGEMHKVSNGLHSPIYFNAFGKDENELFIGDKKQTKSALLQAVLEGILFALYQDMQPLILDQKFEEIRPIGGGTANQQWMQDLADLFQIPVKITNACDCALGAVMLAAKTVGYYESWQEASQAMTKIIKVISPSAEGRTQIRTRYELYSSIIQGGNPI